MADDMEGFHKGLSLDNEGHGPLGLNGMHHALGKESFIFY